MKAIKWVGVAALTAVAGVAQAAEEGNWMVRARVLHMNPHNGNGGGLVGAGAVPDVEAESKVFPEIDISYFFTKNIAAELILTYPQKHDIDLDGLGKIGSVKHLPPTLTLQYHFNPEGTIRPYVGAGINYTRFSSVDLDANLALAGTTGLPLRIDRSSFGWALQVGADYKLADKWFFNVDVKYVTISTDIHVRNDAVALQGQKVSKLDIDPLLVSVGIGYRF
ncbi:MAG: OmpW family outer membrane protein [Methyloversatilis sp.]|uniref:OmpW/AlkL family protein n=1 Tax=Methyloversatilis sp. TaxID=2569862 RepID=UPI0027337C20|nr:OmpW family outer membrane protein [Methyloversatilis sp.]MDP3871988.1 OmpW family outer membrane protein [Methyloversatilis sp.]